MPTYRDLKSEIESALEHAIDASDVKVHGVTARIKEIASFRNKFAKKRYADPLTDMKDIVAARVVCLFPSDLPKIDRIIRDTFLVTDVEDKGNVPSPDLWRYVSIHYDCQIRPSYQGPHYDHIKGQNFEIQVRTILQDAWASVEHYLAYKGKHSIPDELKREFSALAGLFHIADQSFQRLYDESKRSEKEAEALVKHVLAYFATAATAEEENPHKQDIAFPWLQILRKWPTISRQQIMENQPTGEGHVLIDRGTAKALLRQLYPDRESGDDLDYSEFVEELAAVDIVSILTLRQFLIQEEARTLEAERAEPPTESALDHSPTRFTDVGFARTSMSSAIPEFHVTEGDEYGDEGCADADNLGDSDGDE